MTVSTSANIHFGEGDVWHRWNPGNGECHAYGVLKFGESASVFIHRRAEIDRIIAELVALRAEMDPPAPGEGGVLVTAPADEPGPVDGEAELRRAGAIREGAATGLPKMRLAVCGRHAAMDAAGRCDHCDEGKPEHASVTE